MKKSYQQYSAQEFLEDPKFIRWMNGDAEASRFWKEWLEDHPEKKEELMYAQKLFQWLSVEEEEKTPRDKDALWQNIREKSQQDHTLQDESVSQPYPWRRILAYAAMLTLLIVATIYLWPAGSNSFQTAMGEMKSVELPDESQVVLNAATQLTFEETDSNRILYLEGEAFFDVVKGKRFTVESKHGLVSVLGTSFNISDRGTFFEVVCQSGKVQVDLKQNGSFILTQGEYVRRNDDGSIETNDDTKALIQAEAWTAWTEGEFFFHDAQLERVLSELERQFKVNIHMEEDMKEIKGAFYFTNKDLSQALENVLWPLRLDYDQKGNDIYLKRK